MISLRSKYMIAVEGGEADKWKGKPVFYIYNAKHHESLGVVFWSTAWRQYVFHAENEKCVFSGDCLKALSTFCDEWTEELKQRNSE